MSKTTGIYYVYVCKVDGVVKYVGMGKKDRHKHCTSGVSSCPELNRDFFAGRIMEVEIIQKDLSEQDAKNLEAEMIRKDIESLYNRVIKHNPIVKPHLRTIKDIKLVGSNWSVDDREKKAYKQKIEAILPDTETEAEILQILIQAGLALYVVELPTGTRMLTIDKADDNASYNFSADMFAHYAHPEGLYNFEQGLEDELESWH